MCVRVESDVGCSMVLRRFYAVLCWSFSRGWHEPWVYIWYMNVLFVDSYHTSDRNILQTQPNAESALPSKTAIIYWRELWTLKCFQQYDPVGATFAPDPAGSISIRRNHRGPPPLIVQEFPNFLAFGPANFEFIAVVVWMGSCVNSSLIPTCVWYLRNFVEVLVFKLQTCTVTLYKFHQFSVYLWVAWVWFIQFSSHLAPLGPPTQHDA